MTIQQLYENIDGDYEQAMSVLRLEKLLDKHVRRFTSNGVVEALIAAADGMDPGELFETSHAVKGVCANLGLVKLAEIASQITEEYRPGNVRKLTDEEVKARIETLRGLYARTVEEIRIYAES